MARNIIKKYKLKALKKLGFKQSGPLLGDVYGVVNAYLKEKDKDNAETVANCVAITLQEVVARLESLDVSIENEDAVKIIIGELTTEYHLLFDIAGIIYNDK